jgi:hypothetical protein
MQTLADLSVAYVSFPAGNEVRKLLLYHSLVLQSSVCILYY